ncbi:hypothetical protein EAI_13310 [Harpegnathos saltator]|uniref:Uncharacterized protein n=1 Tax=Harpegnathos saltator TaxID=610380 RepID=E2C2N2_HARSA|nr:hypothetical protein EAI_13310 [Harpegnathos saltator]
MKNPTISYKGTSSFGWEILTPKETIIVIRNMLVSIVSAIYLVEAALQQHRLQTKVEDHGLVLLTEAGPKALYRITMDLPKQYGQYHVYNRCFYQSFQIRRYP